MASPRASRRRRRRAACRCSTPPARWSPRCTIRASVTSARAARLILIGHAGHPEVEGTMGQISEPVTLVQTEKRRRRARHPGRHAGRLCDADHAQRRRHARHHRRAAPPLHRYRRAGDARHLLRDAEPPDRGARTQQAGRRYPGGRRQEQFQLQPAARDRRGGRHAELSDRRRQRGGAGMVRRAPRRVGITAGASAPEVLVEDVIDALRRLGPVEVSELDRAGRRPSSSACRRN